MARKDRVPPELAQEVLRLDGGCVAPKVDHNEIGNCRGRITIEHVKRQLRTGRRAEPVRACLVSLCLGHTETGMKAGRQWNTMAVNRAKIRDYIAAREELLSHDRAPDRA